MSTEALELILAGDPLSVATTVNEYLMPYTCKQTTYSNSIQLDDDEEELRNILRYNSYDGNFIATSVLE